MKIGFVCWEYPPVIHGGIGSFYELLSRGLVEEGHQVCVLARHPVNVTEHDCEDHGVRVWRLHDAAFRGAWVWNRYRMFRVVAEWCRQGAVDVIEVPDYQGWSAMWGSLPVPVISRLHGSCTYFADELGGPIYKTAYLLEKASLKRADYLCSSSQYTAAKTVRLFQLSKAVKVIYNGVETAPVATDQLRRTGQVIFTGTLAFKKGVESIVRAWPLVKKACPHAELLMLGKDGRAAHGGSMRSHLESLLDDQTAKSVCFRGHLTRDEVLEALRVATVAVFPSYMEAFALAPLEAMAQGCPTIYSKQGSGYELITHGKNGLLIAPDRPAEIAEAIVKVLTDQALARRLGERGRKHVENHFSIRALLAHSRDFYENCVKDFKQRRTVFSMRPRNSVHARQ